MCDKVLFLCKKLNTVWVMKSYAAEQTYMTKSLLQQALKPASIHTLCIPDAFSFLKNMKY